MALPIRPEDLPAVPGGTVAADSALIIDDGDGVFKATPGQVLEGGIPGTLGVDDGAALVGTIERFTAAVAETVQSRLRQGPISLGGSLTLGGGSAAANLTILQSAYSYFHANRTNPPLANANWGLGFLDAPKGRIGLDPFTTAAGQGPTSFGIRGQGKYVTSLEYDIGTTETAYTVGPTYAAVPFEDLCLLNLTAGAIRTGAGLESTVCFKLDGTDGGGGFELRRVAIEGFKTGIQVTSAFNADTTYLERVSLGSGDHESMEIGIDPGNTSQAVINLAVNCSNYCTAALLRVSDGADWTFVSHNGLIGNSLVQYIDGAAAPSNRAAFISSKLEYHEVGGALLLLDGTLLTADTSGAFIWRDSVLNGGLAAPSADAVLSGGKYYAPIDDHEIISYAKAGPALDFKGGIMRGAINLARTSNDYTSISRVDDMDYGPLPQKLTLSGGGAHPLIRWRGNERVADCYMGGQAGNRTLDAQQQFIWRCAEGVSPSSPYLLNTNEFTTDFAGRKGADFEVGGQAVQVGNADVWHYGLMPGTLMMGLRAFIAGYSGTADLEITWYEDDTFDPGVALDTLAIPVQTVFPAWFTVSTKEWVLPDGIAYIRITAQATGRVVFGGLSIPYNPLIVAAS